MKLFICIVLLLSALAAPSFAAVAIGFYNNPKNPGKCTISNNLILSPGDIVKNPNQDCGRIICGLKGEAQFQSCGVEFHEGCTLGDYINKSLNYPECCKRHLICN